MSGELAADRRPDEVGAIGIESLVHQQIDMAKVDESEVDCDFLSLARLVSQADLILRPSSVLINHLYGWYMDGTKRIARGPDLS